MEFTPITFAETNSKGRNYFKHALKPYQAKTIMSKNKKILLGILTFSPILGMIIYFICFIGMFSSIGMAAGGGNPELHSEDMATFMGIMGTAMMVLLVTILITFGMTVYYIIHVVNNEKLDKEKNEHIIWILLVLMAGYIGQAVYWYMKIWKENPNDSSLENV